LDRGIEAGATAALIDRGVTRREAQFVIVVVLGAAHHSFRNAAMDPVVALPIILTLGTFTTPLEMFRRLYYLITIVMERKSVKRTARCIVCFVFCVVHALHF
jgi:hypothetical protein